MSCPNAVPKNRGRVAIIRIAELNPSLGGGTPLFDRAELLVGCSGGKSTTIGLTFFGFALSALTASRGAASLKSFGACLTCTGTALSVAGIVACRATGGAAGCGAGTGAGC